MSRLISGQKNDPLGFQNSDFDEIIDIRSIWICLHHAHQKDNCFLEYRTQEHVRRGNFALIRNVTAFLKSIFCILVSILMPIFTWRKL